MFKHIDLQSLPGQERFDYWRELFVGTTLERDRDERARSFDGDMLAGVTSDGVSFLSLRSDPLVCTFGKQDTGLVLLGLMREGTLRLRDAHDGAAAIDPGTGLVLFDCDRPAVTSSTRYDMVYLALPRDLVVATMGGDPVGRDGPLRALPCDGIAPVLYSHLRAMAAHGNRLSPAESEAAMRAATQMSLAFLSRFNSLPNADDAAVDEALFGAAQRFMVANLDRHSLTAGQIAAGVGCSRARLYRIFAQRETTVGDCLRTIRLNRAKLLLRNLPDEPIASIAFDVGYTDLSAFGKVFKRHSGLSPSDWRLLHHPSRF